ncbi:hypothetical protein M3Y94_01052200 [Aphelenchoides besseyi]|nr:hypothetical protein M3Y94_01052200 [Aphelenchoides besseyi]KAI6224098.1 hypothetical protein M3Y95_00847400 [Aphelenchoides besseyi]
MFESPRLCFSLDEDGHEMVNFDDPQLNYQPILIIHRLSTVFWCVIGLALNTLLFTVILRNPSSLCNLRGVVMFGCVYEMVMCVVWLICIPFTVAGYGRGMNIVNSGFHIPNRTANSILMALTIAFTMGMWSYVTFMFIYRYHLIQHGTHPRRSRLIAYALIPIFTAIFYTYCVLVTWKLEKGTDERALENSMKILHHFGYSLDVAEVREADFNDPKSKLHFALFGLVMAANSGVIIYCSLKIRRILRSGPVTSAATRRLNSDMDRVLLLNACLPFLCNIVPTSFITKKIAECSYNPWSDLFCLTIVNLMFVCSPINTLWFVRPYRRTVQRWLGLDSRRLSFVDSSLTFNNNGATRSPDRTETQTATRRRSSVSFVRVIPVVPAKNLGLLFKKCHI